MTAADYVIIFMPIMILLRVFYMIICTRDYLITDLFAEKNKDYDEHPNVPSLVDDIEYEDYRIGKYMDRRPLIEKFMMVFYIRSVIYGYLYKTQDAFRRGEYVDVGGGLDGTVERVATYSITLRNKNGMLHTIPFCNIKQISNRSRDWVIVRIPLYVPYSEDAEKIKAIVKRIGLSLMEDMSVGELFMQPLKIGTLEVKEDYLIMKAKFMTKPGGQFAAKKKVIYKILEEFSRNGIKVGGGEGIKIGHREELHSSGSDVSNLSA